MPVDLGADTICQGQPAGQEDLAAAGKVECDDIDQWHSPSVTPHPRDDQRLAVPVQRTQPSPRPVGNISALETAPVCGSYR